MAKEPGRNGTTAAGAENGGDAAIPAALGGGDIQAPVDNRGHGLVTVRKVRPPAGLRTVRLVEGSTLSVELVDALPMVAQGEFEPASDADRKAIEAAR